MGVPRVCQGAARRVRGRRESNAERALLVFSLLLRRPAALASHRSLALSAHLSLSHFSSSGIKAQAVPSHETDRYRLGLSDGQLWGTAMLATQHNHLVKDNVIKVGTMLRLDDYLVNEMQGRK